MKSILNLIKQSSTNEDTFKYLESIFSFYDQLQYTINIKQVAEDVYNWLNKEFGINNLIFSLFDINKSSKEDIFVKGKKFYLDDDLSHYFIVTTYTNLNATISFRATSQEHSKIIQEKYEIIEAAFSIISPVIQSSILRKNYIDSLSLDSVINVYSKDYLINKLNKKIKLLENQQSEIFFLMIGIDRFDTVDDRCDYENTHNVLIELAKVIHSNIKEFDIVGRLNVDMFLVSLNNCDEIQASNIAKKIIVDFEEISIPTDSETKETLKKTVCVGLKKYQPKSEDLDKSINHANIALVEAKSKGKSQFLKFSDLKQKDIA
jgi:diguanylate cyclase (GGDEF)-like protein